MRGITAVIDIYFSSFKDGMSTCKLLRWMTTYKLILRNTFQKQSLQSSNCPYNVCTQKSCLHFIHHDIMTFIKPCDNGQKLLWIYWRKLGLLDGLSTHRQRQLFTTYYTESVQTGKTHYGSFRVKRYHLVLTFKPATHQALYLCRCRSSTTSCLYINWWWEKG